jgi:hypothetical protein
MMYLLQLIPSCNCNAVTRCFDIAGEYPGRAADVRISRSIVEAHEVAVVGCAECWSGRDVFFCPPGT